MKLRGITDKKGAIELSIGTIVIVVLAMSMLVLGLVLVRNIFDTSNQAVNDIDNQLSSQIQQLFGEDRNLVLYPNTGLVEVEIGTDRPEGFVIAIKNRGTGGGATTTSAFSYNVEVKDTQVVQKCGVNENGIISLIQTGASESNIQIPTGATENIRVFFQVPTGYLEPCTVRLRVSVFYNNQIYDTETMDVQFKA